MIADCFAEKFRGAEFLRNVFLPGIFSSAFLSNSCEARREQHDEDRNAVFGSPASTRQSRRGVRLSSYPELRSKCV